MFQKIDHNKIFYLDTDNVPEKVTFGELSETGKNFLRSKPNIIVIKIKSLLTLTKRQGYRQSSLELFVCQ